MYVTENVTDNGDSNSTHNDYCETCEVILSPSNTTLYSRSACKFTMLVEYRLESMNTC